MRFSSTLFNAILKASNDGTLPHPWEGLIDHPGDSSHCKECLSSMKMMGSPCQEGRLFPLPLIYYWQSEQCEGLPHFSAAFSYCLFMVAEQDTPGRRFQEQYEEGQLWSQLDAVLSLVTKHGTWNILWDEHNACCSISALTFGKRARQAPQLVTRSKRSPHS